MRLEDVGMALFLHLSINFFILPSIIHLRFLHTEQIPILLIQIQPYVNEMSYKFPSAPASTLKLDIDSPGGCLNKKDGLTRYGDSHIKDKTS